VDVQPAGASAADALEAAEVTIPVVAVPVVIGPVDDVAADPAPVFEDPEALVLVDLVL